MIIIGFLLLEEGYCGGNEVGQLSYIIFILEGFILAPPCDFSLSLFLYYLYVETAQNTPTKKYVECKWTSGRYIHIHALANRTERAA